MFTIIDVEQTSPEWFQARAGRLTGSRASNILAKGKAGAESVLRRDYRMRLACERITGIPGEGAYVNAEMQRGIDLEPIARAAYEAKTGELVTESGFLQSIEDMTGCSLDGSMDNFRGILELKCPKTATHLSYLRNPFLLFEEYSAQVLHNLWVSGAEWCDLVSFDDRLPAKLRLLRVHLERKQLDVAGYVLQARGFLAEVEREVAAIEELERAA